MNRVIFALLVMLASQAEAQQLKGFGDSNTEGSWTSDPATKPYIRLMATELGLTFANYAVSGALMYSSADPSTAEYQNSFRNRCTYGLNTPHYIATFLYGTNDAGSIYPPDNNWKLNYEQYITTNFINQGYNRKYLFIMTTPLYNSTIAGGSYNPFYHATLQQFNALTRQVATDLNIQLFDLYTVMENLLAPANYMADPIHLNDLGHRLIADSLKARIAAVILPVRFVSVAVSCNKLTWKTAEEYNVRSYSVEKSADGMTWRSIGSVAAKGNSGSGTYTFSDTDPQGNNFYRIVENDFNGRTTISTTLRSSCRFDESIEAFPNPFRDQATVRVSAQAPTRVDITVYDMKGTVLHRQKENITEGISQVSLPLGSLPRGLYTVDVLMNGTHRSVLMAKQ